MIEIHNQIELERYVNQRLNSALNDTMNELLDKLLEYINDDVYVGYTPSWYDRTYEFLQSWEINKSTVGNIMESQIFQNENLIQWIGNGFHHGNPYEPVSQWDSANALAKIIEYGAIGSGFGFEGLADRIGSRPFWSDFTNYCNSNFIKIFKLNCNKYGLRGIFT